MARNLNFSRGAMINPYEGLQKGLAGFQSSLGEIYNRKMKEDEIARQEAAKQQAQDNWNKSFSLQQAASQRQQDIADMNKAKYAAEGMLLNNLLPSQKTESQLDMSKVKDMATEQGVNQGQAVEEVGQFGVSPTFMKLLGDRDINSMQPEQIQLLAKEAAIADYKNINPEYGQKQEGILDKAGNLLEAGAQNVTRIPSYMATGIKGLYDYATDDRSQAEIDAAKLEESKKLLNGDTSKIPTFNEYNKTLLSDVNKYAELQKRLGGQATQEDINANAKSILDLPKDKQKELGLYSEVKVARSMEERMKPLLEKYNNMGDSFEKQALGKKILDFQQKQEEANTKLLTKAAEKQAEREDFMFKEDYKTKRKAELDAFKTKLDQQYKSNKSKNEKIASLKDLQSAYEESKSIFSRDDDFPVWLKKNNPSAYKMYFGSMK